jgi:hypothetical protein
MSPRFRGREWHELGDPELPRYLYSLLESSAPRLLVIRSPSAPAGSEFLAAVVRGRPGPGVIVSTQGELLPGASDDRGGARSRAAWKVLVVADDFASIAVTREAMAQVPSIVRDADTEPLIPPLWLPPPLLTAYSLVPPETMPVLAVDSWDDLVTSYYRDRPSIRPPTEDDLEEILLRSLDRGLRSHMILLTRRFRPVLEAGATIVLEITTPERDPSGAPRVRVLQGPVSVPGSDP